jgi:hypothetical protein
VHKQFSTSVTIVTVEGTVTDVARVPRGEGDPLRSVAAHGLLKRCTGQQRDSWASLTPSSGRSGPTSDRHIAEDFRLVSSLTHWLHHVLSPHKLGWHSHSVCLCLASILHTRERMHACIPQVSSAGPTVQCSPRIAMHTLQSNGTYVVAQ